MAKKRKKLIFILPLCLLLACAAGLGVYYINKEAGGIGIAVAGPANNRTIPVRGYNFAQEMEDARYIPLGLVQRPADANDLQIGQFYQIRSDDFYYIGNYMLDEYDPDTIVAYYYCVPLLLPNDPKRALLVLSQKNYCEEIIENHNRPVRSFKGRMTDGYNYWDDSENTMNYSYDPDYERQPKRRDFYAYSDDFVLEELVDGVYPSG